MSSRWVEISPISHADGALDRESILVGDSEIERVIQSRDDVEILLVNDVPGGQRINYRVVCSQVTYLGYNVGWFQNVVLGAFFWSASDLKRSLAERRGHYPMPAVAEALRPFFEAKQELGEGSVLWFEPCANNDLIIVAGRFKFQTVN
jgi:hypothetical protein